MGLMIMESIVNRCINEQNIGASWYNLMKRGYREEIEQNIHQNYIVKNGPVWTQKIKKVKKI